MAFWKQLAIAVLLALLGLGGWGAVDPAARSKLIAGGVPAALLPGWAFLAADTPESPPAVAGERRRPTPGGADAGGRPAGGPAGGRGPALVVTAPVTLTETGDRVRAIGTAEAVRTVAIFPRTTGMVREIGFSAGGRVGEGAVLLRLDDDSERISVEEAKLAVADASAKAARNDKLAENRAISAADRDNSRSELARARLALQEAELALSRRSITAPFAGVAGLTSVEVGDMVSASTEITVIDDRSAMKVEFRIPEAFAARLAAGQAVEVATPSQPGTVFAGTLSAVGSRIEADSRTLTVQATVANSGDLLRPGMSFEVTLHFPGTPAKAVPALSVQWDRDGAYVWTIADGKAKRTGVTIIERTPDQVLVSADLAEGDAVVVEGIQAVRAGAAVRTAGDQAGKPGKATEPAP